jgi:hypothetical protein
VTRRSEYDSDRDEGVSPVPVNADLEIDDRVLGPFTARQCAILAAGGVVIWLGYAGLHHLVPVPVLLVAALILAGSLLAGVSVRRDGLSLERYLAAALGHYRRPRRQLAPDLDGEVPPGYAPISLPVTGLSETGVLDLGVDGAAVLIECAAVNLQLRSGGEVRSALASFGQGLNALGGSFQFTVTAHRIDLSGQAERIEHGAAGLAHPLLEERARAYAGLIRDLGSRSDLIARRVLLILREDGPAAASAGAVLHRAAQAAALLTSCGISARVLDAAEVTAAVSGGFEAARTFAPARSCPPDQPVRLAETGPRADTCESGFTELDDYDEPASRAREV